MRIRRLYLALAILFIALNASLEAVPKDVVISTGFNPLSASPRNPGPYGSSGLVSLLEEAGYKAVVVASVDDIKYASAPGGKLIIAIIAPERLAKNELEGLERLAAEPGVSFLVASENLELFTSKLASAISLEKCGVNISIAPPLTEPYKALYNRTSRAALIVRLPGSKLHVAPTGYVSPVLVNGSYYNVTGRLLPPLKHGRAYIVAIAATPPLKGRPLRIAAAAACGGSRGRVLVIGDSSVFVNEFLSSASDRDVVLDFFKYLGGRGSTVILIADLYGSSASKLIVHFHPSMLLTSLALYYKGLEDEAFTMLASRHYILALIAASLALVAYLALPRGLWVRATRASERLPEHRKPPSFLGEPSRVNLENLRIEELCAFSDRLLRHKLGLSLAEAAADPSILGYLRDEHLRLRIASIAGSCAKLRGGGWAALVRALKRITGLEARERSRLASEIEQLLQRLGL